MSTYSPMIFSNSSYFDQREPKNTPRQTITTKELLNFTNISRDHRNDFLSQVSCMCGTCDEACFHTKHELGCGECAKTFSSKDSLRRHERTVHQLNRQKTHQQGTYACDTCQQKVYRRKARLENLIFPETIRYFVDIMLHFGRRGRENLSNLTRKHFAVKRGADDKLYVYKVIDEQTKNHQSDSELSSHGRMVSCSLSIGKTFPSMTQHGKQTDVCQHVTDDFHQPQVLEECLLPYSDI
ncbi:unnamed protein product [Mytilus coruscus]|uniref:C2H2-type domain-containing protein n=1 Tax=Mytilus coruscus TaxID=42192 RepID=A0A6J8ERZ6_MYTCO|nr:unnamed protein product [Mytilus coruscus]